MVSRTQELWGVETAAQELAQRIVHSVPITMATVALWDQPSSSLTVRGISTSRPLAGSGTVGARVPLARAPWRRALLEREEPVLLDDASGADVRTGSTLGLALVPDLRSVWLVPIRLDAELVGVLALGEMRSSAREAFTEDKRRRALEVLDEFLASSAATWEAGRLRRQVRAMSMLAQTVRQMLERSAHDGVLACLATNVADWLGAPVRAILLRPLPGNGVDVLARWPRGDDSPDGEAARLFLAVARGAGRRHGAVGITRIDDDPLDPFSQEPEQGEGWTRISLPLLKGERLLAVACLYVEGELYLAHWELEVFRWLAEVAGLWTSALDALAEERREGEWLRQATADLLASHQRAVLREALDGIATLVSTALPDRLESRVASVDSAAEDAAAWRSLAEAAVAEVAAVLADLRPATMDPSAKNTTAPLEANILARRAVEIARAGDGAPIAGSPSPAIHFEPAPFPVLVDSSPGLLGALAVAVRSAAEGQPPGDPVRVSVLEGDGQVLIAVSLGGGATAATHRRASLDPLYSSPEHPQLGLTLAVVRSLVARHGGELVLDGEDPTGGGLVVRLPVARRRD
jgi:hypothetical protein